MREPTDTLIERLSRSAAPVKPLWPPYLRAAAFVAGALLVMSAVAALAGQANIVFANLGDMPFAAAFVGALVTGICAVVAAIMTSVPGRSEAWAFLPLPGAVLWLLSGGVECYRYVAAFGLGGDGPFASLGCFLFIVMAGVPAAVGVFFLLRRTVSINLVGVTALAGLGAAMLAVALLQFFHPPGTNPVDFATHIVAVVALMAFMLTLGRRALEGE